MRQITGKNIELQPLEWNANSHSGYLIRLALCVHLSGANCCVSHCRVQSWDWWGCWPLHWLFWCRSAAPVATSGETAEEKLPPSLSKQVCYEFVFAIHMYIHVRTLQNLFAYSYVQYESKKSSRFRSVPFFFPFQPFRSVPYRSVHFCSNRLPWANSFSARHEFVCKIHCLCWRSIARLFSTTRSRDGFFLP